MKKYCHHGINLWIKTISHRTGNTEVIFKQYII
nr:MAG TPA: hypothetical protein [Caudoviricetes sp.]